MLADMSERELADWEAAYENDPWGEERGDKRMARQCWVTAGPYAKKTVDEKDYLFHFQPKPPPSPENYRLKANFRYAMIARKFSD